MEIIYTKKSKNLAEKVADSLTTTAYPAIVKRFSNDEMIVSTQKTFSDVTVIANTLSNDDWLELFLLLDALKNSRRINLCLTYMGYARQDTVNPNESNGNALFGRILESFNISKFIFVDNHNEPQLNRPFDHIPTASLFINDIKKKHDLEKTAIVSPDLGRAKNAQFISDFLKCDLALCVKNKDVFEKVNRSKAFGDVSDKVCVLVDDIIDTGNTICYAAEALLRSGARKVFAYATHGILSAGAIERLNNPKIEEVVLTDSIFDDVPLPPKFKKLSIASLITEAIRCIL